MDVGYFYSCDGILVLKYFILSAQNIPSECLAHAQECVCVCVS